MKKLLFWCIIAAAVTLTGCDSNNDGNNGGGGNGDGGSVDMDIAISLYNASMNQHTAAMDPFYIALRLNALIVESGIGNSIDETIKTELFGSGTSISSSTPDSPDGYYTLTLNTAPVTSDYARTGELRIFTNGNETLENTNSYWTLRTINNAPYSVNFGGTVEISLPEGTSSYTVSRGAGKWDVNMENFASKFSNIPYQSDWNGFFTVTPEDPAATVREMFTKKHSVVVNVSNSVSMSLADALDAYTELPIIYNPDCGTRALAPGGKLRVGSSGNMDSEGYFCIITWMNSLSGCIPPVKLYFNKSEIDG